MNKTLTKMRVPNLELFELGLPSTEGYSKLFEFFRRQPPSEIDFLVFGSCVRYLSRSDLKVPPGIVFSDVDIFIFVEDITSLCSIPWYVKLTDFKNQLGVFLSIRLLGMNQAQWSQMSIPKKYWEDIWGQEHFVSRAELVSRLGKVAPCCTSQADISDLTDDLRSRILDLDRDWHEPFPNILFDEIGYLTSRIKNLGLFLQDVAYWKTHSGERGFLEKLGDFGRDLEKSKNGLREAVESRDKLFFLREADKLVRMTLKDKGLNILGAIK